MDAATIAEPPALPCSVLTAIRFERFSMLSWNRQAAPPSPARRDMIGRAMVAFRRQVVVIARATLSMQALVLALGTAQVCLDREHTHGGVAVPDCPMHHQAPNTPGDAGHAHHGHPTTTDATNGGSPQITCRCPTDVLSTFVGLFAVVDPPLTASSLVPTALLGPPRNTSAPDHDSSPPSPPPR